MEILHSGAELASSSRRVRQHREASAAGFPGVFHFATFSAPFYQFILCPPTVLARCVSWMNGKQLLLLAHRQ